MVANLFFGGNMRLKKSIFTFITAGLITTSSFASSEIFSTSWDVSSGAAGIVYSPDYSDSDMVLAAEVSHSTRGEQRIYFTLGYLDDSDICTYENEYADDETFIFSGQAVKMLRWCKQYSDGQYVYEYTPATIHGHSYVINLFKKATAPVKIKIGNETILFPVMGFTKAWNSAGGHAI